MRKIRFFKKIILVIVLSIIYMSSYCIDPPEINWETNVIVENKGWVTTADKTSDGGYILGGTLLEDNSSIYCDVFLLKINSLGQQEWIKTFGDPNQNEYSVYSISVKQTPDGGYVFLYRNAQDEHGQYTALVIKTNALGETLWEYTQTDLLTPPGDIILYSQGGYLFCDGACGYLINDSGEFVNTYLFSLFLTHFPYELLGASSGSLKNTDDGGFVFVSWASFADNSAGGPYYYSGSGLHKYDSSGNKQWFSSFSELFEKVFVLSDGYLVNGSGQHVAKVGKNPINEFDYLWNYQITNFNDDRINVSQDEKLVYIHDEGNGVLRVFKTEQHPPMNEVWSMNFNDTGIVNTTKRDIIPTNDGGYLVWIAATELTENDEGVNKLIKLGPDPELTFSFEDNQQGWASGGAEGYFSLADASYTSDSLMLQAVDNNTYGYWESSRDLVPYVPDSLYKATLNVRGTVPQEIAPTFRCRMNAHNATVIGLLTVDSFLDGAESPANDDAGTTYTIFYDPLDQSGYQDNELTDDLFLGVEIVNLYSDNATTGGFCFDNVVIDRFDKSLMPAGTLVKTYDTTADFATWQLGGAPDFFTMPIGVASSDSLTLTSNNDNTNTYGYWETSRTANEVDIEPNKLYKAVFTVSSTTAQELSPYLRLRINTESNKMSYTYAIFSNLDGENSPTSAGKQYTAYLYPPQSDITQPENQNGLIFAMDLANIPIAVPDDPNGTLTLEKVEISTIPIELVP